MKYLLKYGEINENHQDIADYERFFNYCLDVINSNRLKHDDIFEILYVSLSKFENKYLISMTLRLISNLSVVKSIPLDELERYLNIDQTRNATFLILSKNKEKRLNFEIKKFLYDCSFESKDFFLFLETMREEVEHFLNLRDYKFLRKQLLIMNYLKMTNNTDYFFNYLGSNDKSICYLVFEHIVMLLKQIKIEELDKETSQKLCLGDSNNIQVIKNSDLFLVLKDKIHIENVSNFLIYFLPFIKDKAKLYDFIVKKNVDEIARMLKEYFSNNDVIKISPHIHVYSTNLVFKTFSNELHFIDEDVNFDFLFNGAASFKSHSDCIEL